jgi:putative salt-induced outer membrane protein YdiY
MKKLTLPLAVVCLASSMAFADQIVTVHGDVINGKISLIHAGKVTITTAFAGDLSIAREDIKSMNYAAEEILYARTNAEDKAKTEVKTTTNDAGETTLVDLRNNTYQLADVATLWDTSADDPDFPTPKLWAFSASLGLSGHTGATKDFSLSAYIDALRTTEETKLKLYASVNKTRADGATTAAQYIAGLDFEPKLGDSEVWSAYFRDEIQHNRFSDYRLRNVAAGGLGYYFFNETVEGKAHALRGRVGLAYTYTDHYTHELNSNEGLTDNDIALDLGLLFHWEFQSGVTWNTELTYTPVIDDLTNGVIVHETKVSYLLKELATISSYLNDISLEAGIRNEYQTDPEPGQCHTDTAWYIRFSKAW